MNITLSQFNTQLLSEVISSNYHFYSGPFFALTALFTICGKLSTMYSSSWPSSLLLHSYLLFFSPCKLFCSYFLIKLNSFYRNVAESIGISRVTERKRNRNLCEIAWPMCMHYLNTTDVWEVKWISSTLIVSVIISTVNILLKFCYIKIKPSVIF